MLHMVFIKTLASRDSCKCCCHYCRMLDHKPKSWWLCGGFRATLGEWGYSWEKRGCNAMFNWVCIESRDTAYLHSGDEEWATRTLDHFSWEQPSDCEPTFHQRYFVCSKNWKPNAFGDVGPIFLWVCWPSCFNLLQSFPSGILHGNVRAILQRGVLVHASFVMQTVKVSFFDTW